MTVPWPIVALVGLLGLLIGSFLNVVIYRVPRGESILFPSSHCPTCDTPIKGRHNVPLLSWIALRGRCATCRTGISARYPMVEGATALLFAAVTVRFGLTLQLPVYLYLVTVGLTVAMIEIDHHRVPDAIVVPSYAVFAFLLLPAGAVDADLWSAGRALIGMGGLAALYFGLTLAYPNGLGFGDVKLAGLLGLALGWLSWSALLLGLVGSLLIAIGVGTFAALGHRPHRLLAVPLGPCLVAASVLALFVAVPVTTWSGSLLAV